MGAKIGGWICCKRSINRSRRLDKSSLGTQDFDCIEVRTCLTRRRWPRSARRIQTLRAFRRADLCYLCVVGLRLSRRGLGLWACWLGWARPLLRRSGVQTLCLLCYAMLCLLVRLPAIHGLNSILLAIERQWACLIASFCTHFSRIAPPERSFGGHGRAPGGPKEAPMILEGHLEPKRAP